MTTICIPKLYSIDAATVVAHRHLLYAGGDDLLPKNYLPLSISSMKEDNNLTAYLQSSYLDHDNGDHFYWVFYGVINLSQRFNTGSILLLPVESDSDHRFG